MMEKSRLDFEDWCSKQKRFPYAKWHPADTLNYDRAKYPNGRYTMLSAKQAAWEVWQAATVAAKAGTECEVFDTAEGKKVKICYSVVPMPHNSSRNHIDVDVSTEEEAKESGISVIPKEDGEYFTAEQISEYLIKNLRGEDIVEILKCQKESDMIVFHSSVGRWIRNTFKLWDAKNPYLDGMHPDEMSTEILKGVWRTVVLRETIGM